MKRKLALLLLLSSLALASCQGASTEPLSSPSGPSQGSKAIVLDQKDAELAFGEKLRLTYAISPSAQGEEVLFSSSNPSVASVDQAGVVTANESVGRATVSLKLKSDPSVSASLKVTTVSRVRVSSIEATSSDIYLSREGGTVRFSYRVLPSNATEKGVDISVEDPSIASLNPSKDAITGLKPGKTKLILKSKETFSGVSLEIPVTVNEEGYVALSRDPNLSPVRYVDQRSVQESQGYESLPGTSAQQKVLILPIEFQDFTFQRAYGLPEAEAYASLKKDLDTAFNGKGAADTGYWESVSSFYRKSSFGRSNLSFDLAEPFSVPKKASDVLPKKMVASDAVKVIQGVLQQAADAYGKSHQGLSSYDSDKDGILDSIWAIYAPTAVDVNADVVSSNFGTFTASDPSVQGDPSAPKVAEYAWASHDLMYAKGKGKIDAHVYIHETGHLYGLSDYYSYTNLPARAPAGIYDMMDLNVGDHNAWSKLALGWIDPYVYDASKQKTAKVHLGPSQLTGDALLVSAGYENTPFDEYFVLELYTPEGLNAHDAQENYYADLSNQSELLEVPALPQSAGVKIYHVDARLITKPGGRGTDQVYYDNASTASLTDRKFQNPVAIGASNTAAYGRNRTRELFTHLSLVSANVNGGAYFDSFAPFSSTDLFRTGSTFDAESYRIDPSQQGRGRMNSGEALNLKITFQSVSQDGADILLEPLH